MPPKPEYWNPDSRAMNPLFEDANELNHENISLLNQSAHANGGASLFNSNFTTVPHQSYNPHDDFYFGTVNHMSPPGEPYTTALAQQSESIINYNQSSSDSSPNNLNLSPDNSETSASFVADSKQNRPSSITETPHRIINSRQNSLSDTGGIVKPMSKRGAAQRSKRQMLDEQDAILIARDDSELTEEELQLKRKAQNRAAQRAFRERKETKLKELEAKLLQSEEERQNLMDQLEVSRKQIISITTENEILRSNGDINNHHANILSARSTPPVSKFNFPKTQDDFIEHVLKGTNHQLKEENKKKIYADNNGSKLLALGAVWDYLQIKAEEADLDFNSIDFNDVMEKLKGNEQCHGYGPAYPLDLVDQAIASSLN
ncbi:FCR3 Fluconazole resistance protein 3 [Candida maltosa Xu316]